MVLEPLDIKKDPRGSFVETFKFPNDGQVSYLIINPNEARGNHFHERKTEHFAVIYGSAEIVVRDRNTDDMMKVNVSGYKPMVVTITPNHTHAITATDEGCICLIWCDEQFDKEDADTFSEEI